MSIQHSNLRKLRGVHTAAVSLAMFLAIGAFPLTPAFAESQGQGGNSSQDQQGDQDRDQDQDRDRDRDLTDADRDRIRDRLRDGSCQDVAEATDEALGAVRLCIATDRLRDGSCTEGIELGLEALERTRERCRGN